MSEKAKLLDADGNEVQTLAGMMFGAETEHFIVGQTVRWHGHSYLVQDAEIDGNECIGLYSGQSGSVRAPVIEIER